jgi:HAD superfamily hydrolase (TIGR01484 family)
LTSAPALVATDLDGTLLRSDGTASPRTIEAVRRIQDHGLEFIVATARPPRWMHDLTDVIGDHGVAICSNGAFVYDVHRRLVLAERTISADVVTDVVRDLRDAIPGIAFAREAATGFAFEHAYEDEHRAPDVPSIDQIETLLDPRPGKLLARSPSMAAREFLDTVGEVVGDRAIVAFSGIGGLAEISATGVTKAAVLADWCAERGIGSQDVWAFGDMPNDVPMLAWAGRSYAVANAHPDVVAVATHRCASNDGDGVAAVLEEIVG